MDKVVWHYRLLGTGFVFDRYGPYTSNAGILRYEVDMRKKKQR